MNWLFLLTVFVASSVLGKQYCHNNYIWLYSRWILVLILFFKYSLFVFSWHMICSHKFLVSSKQDILYLWLCFCVYYKYAYFFPNWLKIFKIAKKRLQIFRLRRAPPPYIKFHLGKKYNSKKGGASKNIYIFQIYYTPLQCGRKKTTHPLPPWHKWLVFLKKKLTNLFAQDIAWTKSMTEWSPANRLAKR